MTATSLQSYVLHSHQNRQCDLACKKAPQSISSANSLPHSGHIPSASLISDKTEKGYCAKEVAYLFGRNVGTIYRWFESVPGVTLKTNFESALRGKRRYSTLTVPQSVLIRFMNDHNIKIPLSSPRHNPSQAGQRPNR